MLVLNFYHYCVTMSKFFKKKIFKYTLNIYVFNFDPFSPIGLWVKTVFEIFVPLTYSLVKVVNTGFLVQVLVKRGLSTILLLFLLDCL